MKKQSKIILVIITIVFVLSCVPIKYSYKDGGTVSYKAVLYSYTKYHRLETADTYYIANEFLFFPMNFIKGK